MCLDFSLCLPSLASSITKPSIPPQTIYTVHCYKSTAWLCSTKPLCLLFPLFRILIFSLLSLSSAHQNNYLLFLGKTSFSRSRFRLQAQSHLHIGHGSYIFLPPTMLCGNCRGLLYLSTWLRVLRWHIIIFCPPLHSSNLFIPSLLLTFIQFWMWSLMSYWYRQWCGWKRTRSLLSEQNPEQNGMIPTFTPVYKSCD